MVELRPLSELKPRSLTWLSPGRLAVGKLTLLDGDPKLGKSLLTLDMAARLSTGRAWPDGTAGGEAGNVLIFCAEDNDEDTIWPRLKAMGADLSRITVWPSEEELPLLPDDLKTLDEAIERTSARLVILDPLMAMLDAATAASDPRVRRLLRALERLAAKHGCAIVLVRHLNKGSGRPALYRGTGLLAFTAVCRLGWLVARDPADPSRRVLAEMASNLAPPQPSLAFRLVSHADSGQPLVEWLGPSTWGREELLAWRGLRAERRARAAVLLKDLLKDGPRQSADVWQAARAHHLSRSTVRRAKGDVNVQCQRVMHDGRQLTFWLLPDQQIPPQYRPQPGSLDEMLDRINRMFPRRPNDDDDDLDDEAA